MSDVHLSDAALNAFFESPYGPVVKDTTRRTIKVRTEAVRLVKNPGKGKVYKLYGPKRTHQASSPGDPPATDQGMLSASIDHAVGVDAEGVYGVVGSGLKKALWLELGTNNARTITDDYGDEISFPGEGSSRMAARPFLRPALEKAKD